MLRNIIDELLHYIHYIHISYKPNSPEYNFRNYCYLKAKGKIVNEEVVYYFAQ